MFLNTSDRPCSDVLILLHSNLNLFLLRNANRACRRLLMLLNKFDSYSVCKLLKFYDHLPAKWKMDHHQGGCSLVMGRLLGRCSRGLEGTWPRSMISCSLYVFMPGGASLDAACVLLSACSNQLLHLIRHQMLIKSARGIRAGRADLAHPRLG